MAATLVPAELATQPSPRRERQSRQTAEAVALGALGVGLTVVVGLVGAPLWCIVRVLVLGALVSRLMALTRREPSLARASLLAFVGFVGAVVGAAIAYPYLTTTGVTLRALGGVLAAVGGTALLVLAGADAIARVRGWRKLLAVPVVGVVAYAAGFPVAMAVYATNVPRPALGSATPANRGLAYQDARFRTSDGVQLSGWYIPSRNRAAIVLLHGAS